MYLMNSLKYTRHKETIMINEIIKQLNIPGKLIYLSQYGSHLYGLNTENSDLES